MGHAVERPATNARVHTPANDTTNTSDVSSNASSAFDSSNEGNSGNSGNSDGSRNTISESYYNAARKLDSTGNSNDSIKPMTVNQTAIPSAQSHSNSSNGSKPIQSLADHPENESSQSDKNVSENNQKHDKLSRQEQARLHSLKAMLDASNARYEKATRNRRPKFSAGLEIMIISGDHTGKIGVVLDADYIANRALISLSDQESPHWIDFRYLGHAD